jgi:acyl carrier protein
MKSIAEILAEVRPESNFGSSSDFIADGLLDSFDVVTLVAALDKTHGISIGGVDVVPENFMNLNAIKALLAKYGVRQ